MKNQRTPSDRAKTVRYGRHTTFGTAGDDDKEFRTRNNISAGRVTTPDEDDSVSQPQRPRPPPEPPPPLPRRPKPGTRTNNITRQQHAAQEPNTWGKAGHRSQRTQMDRKPKATQKSLLEIQGNLFEEIDKSIRVRTTARTHMLIDKLHPMARQVFWQDIETAPFFNH